LDVEHPRGVQEGHLQGVLEEHHQEAQNYHLVSEVPYWAAVLPVPWASGVPSPLAVPFSVLQTPPGVLPYYFEAAASSLNLLEMIFFLCSFRTGDFRRESPRQCRICSLARPIRSLVYVRWERVSQWEAEVQ